MRAQFDTLAGVVLVKSPYLASGAEGRVADSLVCQVLKGVRRTQMIRENDVIMTWARLPRSFVYVSKAFDKYRAGGSPADCAVPSQTTVHICVIIPDNPTWGYRRIEGEMSKLEVAISKSTVEHVLCDHGFGPSPERIKGKSWKDFISENLATLYVADFFTVEVQRLYGTVRYHVLGHHGHATRFTIDR